jgi:hypothetical protein
MLDMGPRTLEMEKRLVSCLKVLERDLKLPEHSWGVDSGGDSHFH